MRVAVFVDAGYLFGAGASVISGSSQNRRRITLDVPRVMERLKAIAAAKAPTASLLRVYWYDGVRRGRVSPEQRSIADSDDVKLRLGTVSSAGQQKGVDSLIVTDLVELARNQAISDAVLLSGDEDMRIGVEIAQSFGVRVHLIGIEPSRSNQSLALRQECDTTSEWSKAEVSEILSLRTGFETIALAAGLESQSDLDEGIESILRDVVAAFIETLDPDQLTSLADLGERDPIPYEIDRLLLRRSGEEIGRDLERLEVQYLRDQFKTAARAAVPDY